MTDNDRRGAYTPPTDEPLHFDARRPRSGGGGTPPTTLLISAVVLLVLVGAAFVYYRSGVRHDGQAPAVVGNPVGDAKTAPPASEQPVDPAEGLQVYNSENPQAGPAPAPTLAPAPEEPLPRIAGPHASAPVAEAALPAAPARRVAAAEAPKPLPVTPLAPKSAPVKIAKAPTPEQVAAANPPAKAVTTASKSASGAAAVQIGAFSSSAQADKGWNAVARVSPSAMLGKGKRVETVDKGGTTFYRTFVTGFASHEDATAFCNDLKAAGKSCLVK